MGSRAKRAGRKARCYWARDPTRDLAREECGAKGGGFGAQFYAAARFCALANAQARTHACATRVLAGSRTLAHSLPHSQTAGF
eukprot:5741528-Pleurochrysis_carterae.AAC.1